jgi:hypothetical protein
MILIAVAIILLCKWPPRRLHNRLHARAHTNGGIQQVKIDRTDNAFSPAALLLAGCSSSSPLIPDIFLISLYYDDYVPRPDTSQVNFAAFSNLNSLAGDAHLQARVGYFGICINPDGGSWLCSNNATSLAQEVSVDQDPLNLIWLASQFKDSIVFPYLM